MAIDFEEKENEEVNAELNFAALNFIDEDEKGKKIRKNIFVGTNDCIVHEIRKNQRFEDIFTIVNDVKNEEIEKKKATWGIENSEASDLIINNSEELNNTQNALEKEIGKPVERLSYFEYGIDGLVLTKEDLSIITVSREDYEECLQDAKRMKKSLRGIGKELGILKLSNIFSFRRYTFSHEEYQLGCLQVEKRAKLADDEDFLRKYNFIKEGISSKGYTLLRELFVKSEKLGHALETLEKNGKERTELETIDGQVKLLHQAFQEGITTEDYETLMTFIDETRAKVKSEDYDSSKVQIDDSELGKTIKLFVNDLERSKNSISTEEMIRRFKELDNEKEVESRPSVEPIEFAEDTIPVPEAKAPIMEDEIAEENPYKLEIVEEQLELEQEPKMTEKEIQNNMIVSLVLEGSKFTKMMQAIRKREEEIYDREIESKEKSYRLADRYIEKDRASTEELLKLPVDIVDNGCRIGKLYITPDDMRLANMNEKQYEELLDELDVIKSDERALKKDIRINRREARRSSDRGYLADVALYQMQNEKDAIEEAKNKVKRDIAIADFFAGLDVKQFRRATLLVEVVGERNAKKQELDELKYKQEHPEEDEGRVDIMEMALKELIRDGIIPKKEHNELLQYIRGYQTGFENGTFKIVEGYGRDKSSLAQIAYDYIELIDRNIDKIKASEERIKAEEQEAQKQGKKKEEDGLDKF